MGNGATAGIAPGTMLTSTDVKGLLGERFSQMRFDELCIENEDGTFVVSVEQLKHELDQSILSHHYPPDYRPRRNNKGGSESAGDLSPVQTAEAIKTSVSQRREEPVKERNSPSVTNYRNGVHSEHFPPNYSPH